jgi:hypothetical protein
MSSGIASLHKILKDENRQKIIGLLNEKGSLGYTELLDASETGSTGLLNYHLKVLGDFITKNEYGKYVLTDKGKVASAVLLQFPTESNPAQKRRAQKIFWTILALGQAAVLISVITLYFVGIVDVARLTQAFIGFVTGILLAIFGYRMQITMPAPCSEKMKIRTRRAYILGGAWLGFAIAFFGVGLFLAMFFRPLLRYYWSDWYFIFMLIIAPALGAVWGYWVGKRNNFEKPKWMAWIDEKTGFA